MVEHADNIPGKILPSNTRKIAHKATLPTFWEKNAEPEILLIAQNFFVC